MADIITSNIQVNASAQLTTAYGQLPPAYTFKNPFANGSTGNNQADMVCFFEITITAAGSPITLNLSDGSLHQPNGAAFLPVKFKGIVCFNSDQTNKVTVGGGTQPFTPWLAGTTPTEDIMPNSIGCVHVNALAGWTVASGSADRIKFTSAGGSNVVVRGMMVGTSA